MLKAIGLKIRLNREQISADTPRRNSKVKLKAIQFRSDKKLKQSVGYIKIKQMKRVKVIVNGPRIIDLDILLFDQEQVKRPSLEIPHPRMMGRRFVLTPLLEIYDGEDELAEEFRRKNEALTESVELWKPRIS